jgi:hypothetical protein
MALLPSTSKDHPQVLLTPLPEPNAGLLHVSVPCLHHVLQTMIHSCRDPLHLVDLPEAAAAQGHAGRQACTQEAAAVVHLERAAAGADASGGGWGGAAEWACVVLRQLLAGNPCKGELLPELVPMVPLLLGIALDGGVAGGQEGRARAAVLACWQTWQ